MKIFLFGISNVGKTVIGELLARHLGYDFYDIDEEVRKMYNITIEEFVSRGTLFERDQIRCDIVNSLAEEKGDKVVSVTPLSHAEDIQPLFYNADIFCIELIDSVQNIFDRLVFSDENDVIYHDDEYKYEHMDHYLSSIKSDLKWYGYVYRDIKRKFNISGRTPEEAVQAIIKKYRLDKKKR